MATNNCIGAADAQVLTTEGPVTQFPERAVWPPTTPSEFLKTLWGEIPPGKVLIWTLPDKKSRWYAHFDTITADMRFHEYEDVYTGIGLAPWEGMRLASNKRLREWEVAAITAFWADIDVAHPVHKTAKQYPPSIERAMEAIAKLPFEATIIVDSGHGLQLWWVLKEVWLFADAEEREQARRACQWWHRLVKEIFAQFGWDVDSTFDLPRVMRLPGTWNNKNPQERKRVEVTGGSGTRYGRELFTRLVPEDFKATPMGARRNRSGGNGSGNGSGFDPGYSGLVLDPEAEPSFTRMETLLKLEPKFRATWEKRRPDLNDQSASAYDMALANFAVRAKWPDQEVANLLIAFRREHDLEPKLRENYYAVTIGKAHEPMEKQQAEEDLQTTHDAPKTGVQGTAQAAEHPSRAQARKSHPGEPAPPGEPPWWWEPGLGLPLDDAPPARAWTDRRFLWPPRLAYPHGLRWVLPGPQHQGAGSIAAITARPSEWERAFPEEPRPGGGHMIAIDDAGCGSKHAPQHAGARATDPHSAPGVLIIGNPRPAEAWDPVHIVSSVADGLAVASRYPGPVVVCIGTAGMLAQDMGLAEWLAQFAHGAIIHADLDPAGQTAARTLRRDILLAGGKAQARLAPGGLKNPAAAAAAGAPLPSIPPDWSYAETLAQTTDWPHWERIRQAFLAWYDPSETAGTDKKKE